MLFQKKKTLPVILLLDVSGSMKDYINELNKAVNDLIEELSKQQSLKAEINLAIITFGGEEAEYILQLSPISSVKLKEFEAKGRTPMGGALKITKELIEDREIITSDSYRPMVILLSDGIPTDNWEDPLKNFILEGRSKKSERFALGVGSNYNQEILKQFSSGEKVYQAKDAKTIIDFFKFVTMTIKEKSISDNPNKTPCNIFETLFSEIEEKDTKPLSEADKIYERIADLF